MTTGHNPPQPQSPPLCELHRWLRLPFPQRKPVAVTEQEREDLDQLAASLDDNAVNQGLTSGDGGEPK